MNQPVINCPKCKGLMEAGFILDRGHYNTGTVNIWVEGEPVKSFWTGLKVNDKQQFQVRTFRCVNCGYLESYANEARERGSIFS
jgi:predicted nucleic-acid-binding Zn-ribbon protein